MDGLPVFSEGRDGELVAMSPSAPPNEDILQDLIARHPELVAGGGEPLLLIRREQSVPDQLDGNSRFSLDNLFVTRGAVPVLVEVKRAVDTRIRREVIGQLLDYAANGTAYWRPGTLKQAFEDQCEADGVISSEVFSEFIGIDDDDFWEQVDANLDAGRIRMVVAADRIPRELARVIEFLNLQMRAEVLGIELLYYQAEDGRRTLVPRVHGASERAKAGKKTSANLPSTIEEWANIRRDEYGSEVLRHMNDFIAFIESRGGVVHVTKAAGGLCSTYSIGHGKAAYPFLYYASDKGDRIYVYFQQLKAYEVFDDAKRAEFLERFRQATDLRGNNPAGQPSFPASELNNPNVTSLMEEIIGMVRRLGN